MRPRRLPGASVRPLNFTVRRRVKRLRFLTAVAMVGLAGCFPSWPQTAPAVSGRVELRSAAVVGADVYLLPSFRSNCEVSSLHTVTSSDGTFTIKGIHRFEWSVPGDRLARWAVCFNSQGTWYMGYGEMQIGVPRSQVHLTCDLSAPVETQYRDTPDREVWGLCRADDV